MRVIVDTNVFISGLRSQVGFPAAIVDAWKAGRFDLVLSRHLRSEYIRVRGYPRLVGTFKRDEQELDAFFSLLDAIDVMDVAPAGEVRDPDDRHVLGAALHLRADVIVSGDKDLLVLESFEGIPILTPRRFVTLLDEFGDSAS